MNLLHRTDSRRFDVGCTIEIEQTGESLHAHVSLDGNVEIRPGDEVTIHGAPVRIAFGDTVNLRRTATVVRAGALKRLMTHVAGYLELTELYEVSFSDGRAS
ncbi:hypothetical protein [Bradyrhizobium guangzhouense]|uniref:Uncharacterized protein n=1 Tax=Bradyrhizobium guangzhouense TaxID=1325095 RepID=A0AAE5WWG1_9BRAD|nr:hypothetical protein [Bradyrhizobium guangzhouense]QAU44384.1 hypothetical protein XH91_02785 [Bradyrhizobium guangzhouense]RXH09310.1 hypothetical protein EAS54_34010 [Bradyrhizobium guangzhouense]RXH10045.1 hypothetical protein EAS56_24195 [Bradyrhizobium guangzhouense]